MSDWADATAERVVRDHFDTRKKEPAGLHSRIAAELRLAGDAPLLRRDADRLADEVAVLVRDGRLDARSPAADALLDYREPPYSPRADRLWQLEGDVADIKQSLVGLQQDALYKRLPKRWRETIDQLVNLTTPAPEPRGRRRP